MFDPNSTKILSLAGQIMGKENGYALTLFTEKNGIKAPIIPKFTPIKKVIAGSSMADYLTQVYETFLPDRIITTVKNKNGSSLIDPQTFGVSFEKTATSALSGFQQPGQNSTSPLELFYKAQMEQYQRDSDRYRSELRTLQNDHDKLKDTKNDLQRQLATVEEKNELQRERDRVASENTFAGVFKEMRPEIAGLMGVLKAKMGNGNTQPDPNSQLGDPGAKREQTKLSLIVAILNSVPADQFQLFWEMIFRFGQLEEEQQKANILESLRSSTKEVDPQFQEFDKIKNK